MKRVLSLSIIAICAVVAGRADEPQDSVAAKQLDEVVIRGERSQIDSRDGIMTVDLPAMVKDKPVTNILEALNYLPGVMTTASGLQLNGAQSVTIILNGELSNMPLQNLYQLLYSTPVDRLKTVEIMYTAPAKYHVSGAVINIVLKTPRPLDGLMGQARAGYNQAHYASYDAGLAATYAVTDWTLDMNWSVSRGKQWNRQETFSNHRLGDGLHYIEDDMRQISHNLINSIFASISYKTLKITYNGQVTTDSEATSLSDGTFGSYVNRYQYPAPTGYHNLAARYKFKSGLTVGADYTRYDEDRSQRLVKGDSPLVEADNNQSINRYHVYADMEHSVGKWQMTYGLEYQHSDDHSRQSYTLPVQEGFDSALREDVGDAYVGVQRSFGFGLSFNASVKGEYYSNTYQHSWNVIPQLGTTYYKTPKSIFQLNLSSNRVYPAYWALHGGTAYVSDYSTIIGNPALQPYMNYAGQLSYIFRQKYAATFYVLYADDYSVQLPYQSPDDLHLIFQTLNFDFSRTVGLQIQAPINVRNIWNATAVANISHRQEKATHFHATSFDNRLWSIYAGLRNTVRFTPSCPLSLSLDFSYISGSIQGNGVFSPMWKADAGAKWMFGKSRCCELDLKFNDIFNTWNADLRINTGGQDYRMKIHDMTHSMQATFVWRFNGFKSQSSTIDTTRFGTGN